MATPLAAAGVIGQLNNPEYLNWVKATRAVHITMEAMRTFCQVKMQDLHQQLLLKHGGTQCSGTCSSTNITYNRSTNNYVMNCPNSVCSGWLADIVAKRATTTTRLTFGNCDISQWPVQPWQIAKAFMNKQEPSSVSPNDTDASGILQLLKNCKYFTPFLDTNKAHVVRLYICLEVVCTNTFTFTVYFIVSLIIPELFDTVMINYRKVDQCPMLESRKSKRICTTNMY